MPEGSRILMGDTRHGSLQPYSAVALGGTQHTGTNVFILIQVCSGALVPENLTPVSKRTSVRNNTALAEALST
jgi:hypothetical protein